MNLARQYVEPDFFRKKIMQSKVNDFASHLESVNWKYISLRENLSEAFIEKFQDYIDWRYLSVNDKLSLSDEFIFKFRNKMNMVLYYERLAKDALVA